MLRIVRQGSGWVVMREGVVLKDSAGRSVHATEQSAVRYVIRLAAESNDRIEPRIWTRHHDNGWLAQVSLTEDGGLGWQALGSPQQRGALHTALDIEEARERADAAVSATGHVCSRRCGSW
jgi:hypothetical protein